MNNRQIHNIKLLICILIILLSSVSYSYANDSFFEDDEPFIADDIDIEEMKNEETESDIISSDDFFNDDNNIDTDLDYKPTLKEAMQLQQSQIWDPFESFNRTIFDFNEWMLTYIIKPFNDYIYVNITTSGMRRVISNFVENWKLPLTFANYVLQLDFKNSAKTLYAFVLNTTYGIAGLFDPAGYQDVKPERTNFGITLAKYYVPSGPYVVLPFFGPRDLRGLIGDVNETALSPLSYNLLKVGGEYDLLDTWLQYTNTGLFALDSMHFAVGTFYTLLQSSFDPYVLARTAYYQSQSYQINKVRSK